MATRGVASALPGHSFSLSTRSGKAGCARGAAGVTAGSATLALDLRYCGGGRIDILMTSLIARCRVNSCKSGRNRRGNRRQSRAFKKWPVRSRHRGSTLSSVGLSAMESKSIREQWLGKRRPSREPRLPGKGIYVHPNEPAAIWRSLQYIWDARQR